MVRCFYMLKEVMLHLQHGAAVIDEKMYINGGVHNGRHLDGLQI